MQISSMFIAFGKHVSSETKIMVRQAMLDGRQQKAQPLGLGHPWGHLLYPPNTFDPGLCNLHFTTNVLICHGIAVFGDILHIFKS